MESSPAARAERIRHIFSNRDDYRDFHLRAQVRCTGDSGSLVSRAGFDFFGYDAQVNFQRFTGTLYVNSKKVVRTGGGKAIRLPEGEWVDLEVIAQGTRLRVMVNGKETTDFTDKDNEFKIGHIALRHHRNSTIEFRRIDIKELN